MRFERNEELYRTVKAVYAAIKNYNRGDVLPFEVVEKAADCKRYDGQWGQIIRKVRKLVLRNRGIAWRPVVGVGYRFLTTDEQCTIPARDRRKRASKQLGMGLRELDCVGDEPLTLHQQILRAAAMDAMKDERRSVKSGMASFFKEVRKTETLPIRRD